MRRLLPNAVVGAFAGFVLGFLASSNLAAVGIDVSGWPVMGFGGMGAVCGSLVGAFLHSPDSRARAVARWCLVGATALGGIAFLVGFVGPMFWHPDWPQGPMLGIFCTGPLGACAGAILGAVTGLLLPAPPTPRENRSRIHPSFPAW